jgi:hypothetical protein
MTDEEHEEYRQLKEHTKMIRLTNEEKERMVEVSAELELNNETAALMACLKDCHRRWVVLGSNEGRPGTR